MKKLKISLEDLTRNFIAKGYSPEQLSVHWRIVEQRVCDKNHRPSSAGQLIYHGFSNLDNYLVFGACSKCGAVIFFERLSDNVTGLPAFIYKPEEEEKAA